MKIEKRRGFNIELMLEQVSEVRTVNPDGSISWSRFGAKDEYESYFRTAIVIEGKTDAFVRSVIKKAMHAKQQPTEASFVKHCKDFAHAMVNKEQKQYKVLFPIWGSKKLLSGRRRWGDALITFDIKQNSRFALRAKRDRTAQLLAHSHNPTKYVKNLENLPLALCSVRAINEFDAFEQSEIAISTELGLYSLSASRDQYLLGGSTSKPINTMLLAPHMTVHDLNGALSNDVFWFNRWSATLSEKTPTNKIAENAKKNAEAVRNRLRYLPWRHSAESALARHYEAFAQFDLEASFLDAWRLLEFIGGPPDVRSETLVKRASWFFEDRDKHHQVGLHLLNRRNLISHGRPVRDENNESLAFQMKQFLTPMLSSYLMNPFNFDCIEEFWEFCDLPVDRKSRTRMAHVIECASKFRHEN